MTITLDYWEWNAAIVRIADCLTQTASEKQRKWLLRLLGYIRRGIGNAIDREVTLSFAKAEFEDVVTLLRRLEVKV